MWYSRRPQSSTFHHAFWAVYSWNSKLQGINNFVYKVALNISLHPVFRRKKALVQLVIGQGFLSRRFSPPYLVIRQVEGNYKHTPNVYSWSTMYTTIYIPLLRPAWHLRSLLSIYDTYGHLFAGGTEISVRPLGCNGIFLGELGDIQVRAVVRLGWHVEEQVDTYPSPLRLVNDPTLQGAGFCFDVIKRISGGFRIGFVATP